MKQEDDKPLTEKELFNRKNKDKITSASVENAHAAGDGAVQKTDELLPDKEEKKPKTDTNPY